jgi:hypothetical protein
LGIYLEKLCQTHSKLKKQDVNFEEPKAKHNCAFKTLDIWWVRDDSYYDY